MKLEIMLDTGAFYPERAHADDAGLDLLSPYAVTIGWDDSIVIDTGVHVNIPKGYAGLIKSKSGLMVNKGIISVGGVIDAGYTGSIKVVLRNTSKKSYWIERGDKITQLLIIPIETPDLELVDGFAETERGANGFGSSGR